MIKFLEKTILLLIANFATTKAWTTNIILKLVDEIYATFYIDRGCEILAQARAITAKFLSACRFLYAQKARPYRH